MSQFSPAQLFRERRLCAIAALTLASACGPSAPAGRPDTAATRQDAVNADATPADTSGRRMILFAGTSLTAGLGLDPDSAYSHMVQRKIDSAGLKFETVNAGVSGETTAGLVQRLDWILRANFDVLVIESGANDGLRGVAPSAIEKNLRQIITRVRAARPAAEICLVQMEALPNYGPTYTAAFHDLYPRIAKDMNVRLLPFLLNNVAGRAELNQADGIHPNMTGEHIVAANIWKGLEPVLRERAHH